MPTQAKAGRSSPKVQTALDILKADHAEVSKLFKQFEKLKDDNDTEEMGAVAAEICKALSVHAQIEEEIFYPALREAADADDDLDEADVEHSHVKELVAQIQESAPGEDLYAARVKVLSEYVKHHVEEEESTLFSEARNADLDLVALGEQLRSRKAELGGDDATPPPAVKSVTDHGGRQTRSAR